MKGSIQTPGNPFLLLDQNYAAESPVRQPISTLGADYLVLAIRRGGMGEVYICERTLFKGQMLALKTFRKELFFDRLSQLAFAQEVAIWTRLSGLPHVIPAIGLEYIDGRPFVTMPAVALNPANRISVRDYLNENPIPVQVIFQWILQTAIGMNLAQKRVPGLVHADLKPENLLVFHSQIFISDFGLARVLEHSHIQSGLDSTWAYKAPECWTLSNVPSPASDVYAFGIILYELLSGRPPFDEQNEAGWARAHRDEVPSFTLSPDSDQLTIGLRDLALKCIEKNPARRPNNFNVVLNDLTAIGEKTDLVMHFMMLYQSVALKNQLENFQQDIRQQLVKTLLLLGFLEEALKELDAMPEMFNDQLWFLKGTALSMMNKDEKAIPCFEKALEYNLSAERRHDYLCDYALSLKRVERFDDALRVYNRLITEVSDQLLPRVVTNLSSVYIRQNRPREVIRLLVPLTQQHPKLADAWGNLGLAYEQSHSYEDACRCFQRAVATAPERADLRIRLAAVRMDHLGMVLDAVDGLNLAFDQGYDEPELYVRLLACYQFLKVDEASRDLREALKDNLMPGAWNNLIREAEDMANRMAQYPGRVED